MCFFLSFLFIYLFIFFFCWAAELRLNKLCCHLSRCFLDCSVGVGVFVTGLSQISSFFFYIYKEIKKTRIEPVGKPYREVFLRSELWPWMAHQPNSWSKHPGTRIEQVLAYCRDEQKYVGCIELLFCLTVTMKFGVRTRKFIGLMEVMLPIYQPSFTEIRWKIREK